MTQRVLRLPSPDGAGADGGQADGDPGEAGDGRPGQVRRQRHRAPQVRAVHLKEGLRQDGIESPGGVVGLHGRKCGNKVWAQVWNTVCCRKGSGRMALSAWGCHQPASGTSSGGSVEGCAGGRGNSLGRMAFGATGMLHHQAKSKASGVRKLELASPSGAPLLCQEASPACQRHAGFSPASGRSQC